VKADAGQRQGRNYIRLMVQDRPGVLAEITAAMRDAGVSIESLIQRGADNGRDVVLAMVTHAGAQSRIADAFTRLAGSDSLLSEPMVMQILD
jgi:homoserine dehydrogenase